MTTKTYTLTVTKAAVNASDDAKLSALMVDGESVRRVRLCYYQHRKPRAGSSGL